MASYGNIFQFTILSQNGDDVDIFISKKNYSGPLMQRPLGRAPILKREANGNILGTSLEIYAECRSDQEYAGLYTSSADEFLVELYKNRVLQWTGFISPELYAEPDLAPPYDVQIIATDGLGELKNYAFAQEDSRPKSYLGHLRNILQHTGSDLEIEVVSSLQYCDDEEWSGNLLSIVADFGHLAKDNAYNALQTILASVNATITQQAGKWLIVRSSDIYDHISEMNPVQFGSMSSCDWWPIGNLSTDVIPAKRHLTLTSSNAYKPTVLQNSLMESDESWVKEFGARYDDNERAFILPAANSGIVQSVSFEQGVGYQLFLRISARNIGDSQESQVLGVSVKIDGRTYQAGNQFWLTRLAGFDSRYVWRNYEGYIEIDLPEPSASDTRSDASNIDIVIPLYKYDSRSYAYATAVEVRLFNPAGLYDIGIYECSLMQYAQTAGKQIEVAILNNARENANAVELGLGDGDYAFPAAEVFRYALPLGYNSESIIRRWRTSSLTESGYLPLMARDYAVQVAKPRIRYRGKLNVPSSALPNIPLLFQRDNTYYILNTYAYDLLLDEIEVELISIPNATVAIESERVEDIASGAAMSNPSGGAAGGEGSGGSGSTTLAGLDDVQIASPSENDALVYDAGLGKWMNKALDKEMSDTSENAVQNKVIKKYIDDLEDDINGRGYLTSAAMGSYATKDDIKDFVTKGSTLAHYGITDAMAVHNEQSNVDLNDLTTPGAYTIGGGTNSHNPHNYGTLLTIHGKSSYYIGQIAIKFDGETYVRSKNDQLGADGDYWTEWRTIVDSSNIGRYAMTQSNADGRYLNKLTGGTVSGQLYIETSAGDRYIHSKCDTAHIAFGVGGGGTNRGIYDFTVGKWWIVRGASEHTDINGTLAVTGAITAKGGMLMNGQGITKWADVGNYISLPYLNINAKLLPTNTFDDGGQLAINFLQNAIYSADKRFTIEHSGEWFEYADYKFFDGSYDSFCQIRAGSTGVLTISNNGGNLIQGYPYGYIYLSFYNTNIPDSATVEVYCNYESQGIGWKTLSRTSTRGSRNGVWVYSNSYYNITHLRITMTASAASSIALCQIDWFLSRGSLSNLPVVTKFAIDQELWGRLICQGGITLGNKTITSWSDFITSDGGNINKGKYLTIGTGSLYCTESRDKLDKLFISGLIEISDLYIGERLWLEDGSSITFRNHNNPQEKDTISSFDDLRIKMISQTATDTVLIEPNVLNKWSTLTNAISLSISFLNGRASVANYYMIEFKTGDTVPTITLPSEVKWEGGYNILNNLAANTTYQISILNNLAVGGAF